MLSQMIKINISTVTNEIDDRCFMWCICLDSPSIAVVFKLIPRSVVRISCLLLQTLLSIVPLVI
jgi:hypothetical protein